MEWTVYSEEKPQKVGSYLVTHITESGHSYVDYDYWTVLDKFKYHPTEVVAWMPFPKPYTVDRKTEPQTEYDKGLKLFVDILFDKEKSNQFLEECKAMGIEPQTERSE